MFFGCKTNVITGKKTLNFFGDNQSLFPTSFQQYRSFLDEHEVVTGTKDASAVARIGNDIANAAALYYAYLGTPNGLDNYAWEYNLVKSEQVNAWCMPGGKIVFYTGIMPVAKNPDGIAAIMGHEVAHALADHGAQRMSLGIVQQAGGLVTAQATKKKRMNENDRN